MCLLCVNAKENILLADVDYEDRELNVKGDAIVSLYPRNTVRQYASYYYNNTFTDIVLIL